MRTKITIFVYCLSIYVPCLAQTFTFRNYSVPRGLPSSRCITDPQLIALFQPSQINTELLYFAKVFAILV
jgi:hypothetical protein